MQCPLGGIGAGGSLLEVRKKVLDETLLTHEMATAVIPLSVPTKIWV